MEGVNDYTVQLYLGSDAYGDPIPVNGASATDDLSDVMKDDGVYIVRRAFRRREHRRRVV